MNAVIGLPVLEPRTLREAGQELVFLFPDNGCEHTQLIGLESTKSAGSGSHESGETIKFRADFRGDIGADAEIACGYISVEVHSILQTVFIGLLWNPNHAGWKREKGRSLSFAEQKDSLRIALSCAIAGQRHGFPGTVRLA
jgi:hypothetical protein